MAALLSTVTGSLGSLPGMLSNLPGAAQNILDRVFPPEQRAEVWAKLQGWVINHPKLAAFLLTNIALTGFPLALFICFSITVAIFSLIAALIIGLLVAVLFTVAMVGVALAIVLPIMFMTTFFATFLFLWGLGAWKLFKWMQKGGPTPEGNAIGDKLNNLTGGSLDWLMDGVRGNAEEAEEDEPTPAPRKKSEAANGTPKREGPPKLQHASGNDAAEKKTNGTPDVQKVTKNVNGVTKRVTKTAGGAKDATSGVTNAAGGVTNAAGGANNAVGTAKGAVGGLTGL